MFDGPHIVSFAAFNCTGAVIVVSAGLGEILLPITQTRAPLAGMCWVAMRKRPAYWILALNILTPN